MGSLNVKLVSSQKDLNQNTRNILQDLKALESMLEESWFNEAPIHIGAEQELCLVDPHCKPKPISLEVLDRIGSPGFTTELAKFNLEINLDPLEYTGNCFSTLAQCIGQKMNELYALGAEMDFDPVMTGILPTLRKTDMEESNLTPLPRYHALMKAISKMRGRKYELRIRGIDELNLKHDSALLEACNTSFQVHLQVAPKDFVQKYNIALAIAAPVLSIATNSPFLFGKRLWSETRIALFQQSVDTRVISEHLRDRSPRVTFGNHWVQDSIIELYREDIVRFRPMLMASANGDVTEEIEEGKTPDLRSLMTHNSTVYRWNRPCYGISPNGKPHLRIENRLLPSGPSIVDEVANAAFWLGLMEGAHQEYGDITKKMEFDDARSNFVAASFSGHDTDVAWLEGRKVNTMELIAKELLPLARQGLKNRKVNTEDIDYYLGIIASRNATRRTGAYWILQSFNKLSKEVLSDERSSTLTSAMIKNQKSGKPIHEWELAARQDSRQWSPTSLLIEEFMTRDVFSVEKDDIPELVANIMDWQRVRFVPVEDKKGHLCGLVTARRLIRYLVDKADNAKHIEKTVKDLMIEDPITIAPDKTVMEAMRLMKQHNAPCLPVVKNNALVGIISEGNFLNVTASLLNVLEEQHES
uniref:Glutamate-cysteine ligase family protein n=1 Tax=Roseihalotalea indica TaxID=2867963 RepID=A0AA49JJC6_9BACT|nr:glutamate-cysteine ligase family protein [Tunicatimonas sp. TK19036]